MASSRACGVGMGEGGERGRQSGGCAFWGRGEERGGGGGGARLVGVGAGVAEELVEGGGEEAPEERVRGARCAGRGDVPPE